MAVDQPPIDLAPAAARLAAVADRVTDSQLDLPTPNRGRRVRDLLAHVVGLAEAFRACADKDFGPWTDTDPSAAGDPELEPDWRDRLAARLPALVTAWQARAAWQGLTRAGGIELAGEVAGVVALDELVLHGWDLARATGQPYDCDDATARVLEQFAQGFDPGGTPGLFGPAVDVADDAPLFDRVLGRTGRDPAWAPGQPQ